MTADRVYLMGASRRPQGRTGGWPSFSTLDRAAAESDRSQWIKIGSLPDGRSVYLTSEWVEGQRWDMTVTEKDADVSCVSAAVVD